MSESSAAQTRVDSVYICARYGRKAEALELAERLEDLGVRITSTWIRQVGDEMGYVTGTTQDFAIKDVQEVRDADGIVYLSEPEDNPWGRGGRHVEFGMAIAFGKQLHLIGPLENLFHYLPNIIQCDNADDFVEYVKENS